MKKVTVVGVGALGSHVVQFLRNAPIELTVIDFDRVESKNVLSQFHGKPGVGKIKTQALKDTMAFLWNAKLKMVPHKLTDGNVKQLLDGADLIIDCLDNGEGRRVVQRYVREFDEPLGSKVYAPGLLHGALAPGGSFGQAVWDQNFVIDDEASGAAATCEDGGFLPFIAIVAAYLAHAAQAFLVTGQQPSYMIHQTGAMRVA